MNTQAERIAAGLVTPERDWMLDLWTWPKGAAYSAVAEFLQGRGLLDRAWDFTPLGLAVRAVLEGEGDGMATD